MSFSDRGRASGAAVGAVLVVLAAVLALGTWAASSGGDDVVTGGHALDRLPSPEQSSTPPAEGGEPVASEGDGTNPGWWNVLTALLLLVMALLGIAAVLAATLWAVRRIRLPRRRDGAHHQRDVEEDDVLAPATVLARRLAEDAESHRRLLGDGAARNAIVACWKRFEAEAGEAGIPRHDWETSSEYVLRILDLVAADTHAVAELAVLYREARFSEHELGEEHRRAALAALTEIQAHLLGVGGRR